MSESSASARAYRTWHKRLNRERGPARNHKCKICGTPARHWAYDHLDPVEQSSPLGPFTEDITHYWPLCLSCHGDLDNSHRRRTNGLGWEADAAPLVERLAAGAPAADPWVGAGRGVSPTPR